MGEAGAPLGAGWAWPLFSPMRGRWLDSVALPVDKRVWGSNGCPLPEQNGFSCQGLKPDRPALESPATAPGKQLARGAQRAHGVEALAAQALAAQALAGMALAHGRPGAALAWAGENPASSRLYLQDNACYYFGGVPSAFDATTSI